MSSADARDSRISVVDQEAIEAHLGLVLERIEAVEQAALKPADITASVRAGIAEAACNPDTWAAAVSGIRASTEHHAGRWLVGAMWSVLRKALVVIVIGMLVYSVGGWSALSALWKAVWGQQP